MDGQVKLKFDTWKIKLSERGKGRMKVTIKLNKEEAESMKNWLAAIDLPKDVPEEKFFKHVFFTGMNVLNQQIQEMAEKEIAKMQLAAQKEAALKDSQGNPVAITPGPVTPAIEPVNAPQPQ